MITLCMDTSHKSLTVILYKNYEVVYYYSKECFKKQSELIFKVLEEMKNITNINPLDIDEVVVTKGPGSYTGVRIAMSIAKVFCSLNNKKLYTIDTLKLYSCGNKNTAVIMDARSGRCYFGIFNEGESIVDTTIKNIDEASTLFSNYELIGDLSLFNKEDNYLDLKESFIRLKNYWEKIDNIHLLTPTYLKDAASYLVK